MKPLRYFSIILIFCLILVSGLSALAVKHTVLVGNFFFNPSTLNVSVGDTIRWQWSAGTHTTTSGNIPSGAATWDELITSSNQVYEYKVTVAGTYDYVCTPHIGMGMVASFTASGFVPTLAVSPPSRNVTASVGTTTFNVTSNTAWTSISNSGWCTIGSGGSGNGVITANYAENTSTISRTATITVSVTGLPNQTVTVIQEGAAPTLSVGPSNQNAPEGSGSTTFSVTSNTSWTSESSASWCSVTPSGNGNGTITANYEANTTHAVRVATISITVSGLPVQTVTVTQSASTVGLSDHEPVSIMAYPNPTTGIFRLVNNGGDIAGSTVKILDFSGRSILSRECRTAADAVFDLTSQVRGSYLIILDSGGSSVVKKIMLTE